VYWVTTGFTKEVVTVVAGTVTGVGTGRVVVGAGDAVVLPAAAGGGADWSAAGTLLSAVGTGGCCEGTRRSRPPDDVTAFEDGN
jgi:hypothetical protein